MFAENFLREKILQFFHYAKPTRKCFLSDLNVHWQAKIKVYRCKPIEILLVAVYSNHAKSYNLPN